MLRCQLIVTVAVPVPCSQSDVRAPLPPVQRAVVGQCLPARKPGLVVAGPAGGLGQGVAGPGGVSGHQRGHGPAPDVRGGVRVTSVTSTQRAA